MVESDRSTLDSPTLTSSLSNISDIIENNVSLYLNRLALGDLSLLAVSHEYLQVITSQMENRIFTSPK